MYNVANHKIKISANESILHDIEQIQINTLQAI